MFEKKPKCPRKNQNESTDLWMMLQNTFQKIIRSWFFRLRTNQAMMFLQTFRSSWAYRNNMDVMLLHFRLELRNDRFRLDDRLDSGRTEKDDKRTGGNWKSGKLLLCGVDLKLLKWNVVLI